MVIFSRYPAHHHKRFRQESYILILFHKLHPNIPNKMNEEKTSKNQALIKHAYAAFNARDIDAILAVMHPEIKWSKAWEGDYAHGHDDVRAYWTRQWQEINPKVTPVGFHERANGTLAVEVDQLVKDLEGNILFDGKVTHVYIIHNGLLQQMDIELI